MWHFDSDALLTVSCVGKMLCVGHLKKECYDYAIIDLKFKTYSRCIGFKSLKRQEIFQFIWLSHQHINRNMEYIG